MGRAPYHTQRRQPAAHKTYRVPGSKVIVRKYLPGFSRQLAAMLTSGIPIVSALDTLHEQADYAHFKSLIAQVRASIEGGAAFSEALRQYPSVFDDLYCNMVRGGETGGQLAETVGRLAGFLESAAKLRRKVTSALAYPVVILCLAILISTGMIIFIVPVFADMYEDFGGDLPGATQALVNFSDFLVARGWIVLVALIVIVIAVKQWAKTPKGGLTVDELKLRLPIIGDLLRKLAASRFARTLGEMVRCGVPILTALEITSGATGNRLVEKVVLEARDSVEQGEPLSVSLSQQRVLPLTLVRMLQAGEKAGRIDEMMSNIADFYEDEIDTTLSGLTSLLEPILMVVLGVIIGSIVICMFLPIFRITEIIG